MKTLNLRQNWPLWAVGLMLAFVSLLLYVFFPRKVAIPYGIDLNYWSLLSQSNPRNYSNFFLIWLGFVVVTIILWAFASRLRRDNGSNFIVVSCLLLLANLMTSCLCGLTILPGDGTTLEHVQSIQFKNRIYQLSLAHTVGGGMDYAYAQYLVYKCDNTGNLCNWIDEFPSYPLTDEAGKLRIGADNLLYFEQGEDQLVVAR